MFYALRRIPYERLKKDEQSYTKIDIVYTLIGLVLLFADIGSDLYIAVLHLMSNHYYWFTLTLLCVLSSSFVCSIISSMWYYQDVQQKKKWKELKKGQLNEDEYPSFVGNVSAGIWMSRVIAIILLISPAVRFVNFWPLTHFIPMILMITYTLLFVLIILCYQ